MYTNFAIALQSRSSMHANRAFVLLPRSNSCSRHWRKFYRAIEAGVVPALLSSTKRVDNVDQPKAHSSVRQPYELLYEL